MATANDRGMNAELSEGMTDGKYKKRETRERGGITEPTTAANRQHLHDTWYGVNTESPTKMRPDGVATT